MLGVRAEHYGKTQSDSKESVSRKSSPTSDSSRCVSSGGSRATSLGQPFAFLEVSGVPEITTIAKTLNDIQTLQDEMSSWLSVVEELENRAFVKEMMGFTTVYFLQLLAHATLDRLRNELQPFGDPCADKYFSMYDQPGLLEERTRLENISGLFVLLIVFERFVDLKAPSPPNKEAKDSLEGKYKRILRCLKIDKVIYDKTINEFNLIRLTRNSLHGGGVYREARKRTISLKGHWYTLEQGEQVVPLRLFDIVETMWKHFLVITEGKGCFAV